MSRKLELAPIAMLAVLAAAGCGSQSHGRPSQSQGRSTLLAAADPICQRASVKTAAANAALRQVSASTAKTLQVLQQLAPGIAAEEQRAAYALGTLRQSGSQTNDWQTMLLDMRTLANKDTQLAAAAAAKNIGAINRIVTGGLQVQRKLTVIAERDGFAYCGRAN
jgi:hypothetical protein